VEIIWANGAIANKWLRVEVLASAHTGLATNDVFFWGNKVGDTGVGGGAKFTTAVVADGAHIAQHMGPNAGISNLYDFNRDNAVSTSGDRSIVLTNLGALTKINIPAAGPSGTGGPFAPQGGGDNQVVLGGDAGISAALAHRWESTSSDTLRPAPIDVVVSPGQARAGDATTRSPLIEDALFEEYELGRGEGEFDLDDDLLESLVVGRK
jgi:hypothetical protein